MSSSSNEASPDDSATHIYVLRDLSGGGEGHDIEAHVNADSAAAALETFRELDANADVEIVQLTLKCVTSPQKKETKPKSSKPKSSKKSKSTQVVDSEDDHDSDDEDNDSSPKPSKEEIAKARKTLPEGKPDVLKGLKLVFTGKLEKDRRTCEYAVRHYGGEVLTTAKLADADYAVVAKQAGEQRLKSIKAAGLKRLSEEEFFEMLKTGVPPETLDRVDSHESDDEPVKKKQKKKH